MLVSFGVQSKAALECGHFTVVLLVSVYVFFVLEVKKVIFLYQVIGQVREQIVRP